MRVEEYWSWSFFDKPMLLQKWKLNNGLRWLALNGPAMEPWVSCVENFSKTCAWAICNSDALHQLIKNSYKFIYNLDEQNLRQSILLRPRYFSTQNLPKIFFQVASLSSQRFSLSLLQPPWRWGHWAKSLPPLPFSLVDLLFFFLVLDFLPIKYISGSFPLSI